MEVIYVTRGQGEIFLLYLALGFLVGALYGCFRFFSWILGDNVAAKIVSWALFGAASGGAITGAGAAINNGALHVYTALAIITGALLWIRFFHRPLAYALSKRFEKRWQPILVRAAATHRKKRYQKAVSRQEMKEELTAKREAERDKQQAFRADRQEKQQVLSAAKAEKKSARQHARRDKLKHAKTIREKK